MSKLCTLKEEELTRMTAAQQVNEFIWKPGRNGNIEFCGNFKRLQEKEPKTAALLLGHFEEEEFQTEDVIYTYKIYHSQYGYSVGRRKKPVPDMVNTSIEVNTLPKTDQKVNSVIDHTSEQALVRITISLEALTKL
jgi:hypothetical protein